MHGMQRLWQRWSGLLPSMKSGRVEEWESGRVEEKSRTTDAVHVVVVVLIFFCYFSAPGCCR
jgi:hypothetical protein